MTAIDLCAEAPALEDLIDAASALRLEQALARAAAPLLEGLAETVRRSMRTAAGMRSAPAAPGTCAGGISSAGRSP